MRPHVCFATASPPVTRTLLSATLNS